MAEQGICNGMQNSWAPFWAESSWSWKLQAPALFMNPQFMLPFRDGAPNNSLLAHCASPCSGGYGGESLTSIIIFSTGEINGGLQLHLDHIGKPQAELFKEHIPERGNRTWKRSPENLCQHSRFCYYLFFTITKCSYAGSCFNSDRM